VLVGARDDALKRVVQLDVATSRGFQTWRWLRHGGNEKQTNQKNEKRSRRMDNGI